MYSGKVYKTFNISAKSLTIYFQNMMHDGTHLASRAVFVCIIAVVLVCIKGTELFQVLGQSCTLTSCCMHTLSSG